MCSININPNNINFTNNINQNDVATNNIATNSEMFKGLTPSNLIYQYLDNLAHTGGLNIQNKSEIITPSGVENYNNYTELDKSGNEIVKVTYSKENDIITQNIKTKSPNGMSVEKITKNGPAENSMSFTVKDKNGNIILSRNKSYKKIDDNHAQTIVNGEVYDISGLKKKVIKVTHNGKTTKINLKKMLNKVVVADKDKYDNAKYRDEKITNEEKNKIFSKIRTLNGDDLIRLSESVEKLQYFEGMDSFFQPCDKSLQLQTKDIFTDDITVHELGHAYNHRDEVSCNGVLMSNNDAFKNIRIEATKNYLATQNHTDNDQRFYGKFLDTANSMQYNNNDETLGNSNLQDEIFAESYNIMNNTQIVDYYYGMGCPGRILSMMKYMPTVFSEIDKVI